MLTIILNSSLIMKGVSRMFDIFDLILGPFNPFQVTIKGRNKKDESDSKSFDFFHTMMTMMMTTTKEISRIINTAYFLNFITISFNFSTI